jgi:hypothetical protein
MDLNCYKYSHGDFETTIIKYEDSISVTCLDKKNIKLFKNNFTIEDTPTFNPMPETLKKYIWFLNLSFFYAVN